MILGDEMKKQIIVIVVLIAIILIIGGYFLLKPEDVEGGCFTIPDDNPAKQECCENWARENNVGAPNCVYFWQVIEGECTAMCEDVI